ncbi:MAG: hypothetical protein HY717_23340 [Planctomycetes bacterium]|nr:hypothetical protein [Planctomycetota bacterium]
MKNPRSSALADQERDHTVWTIVELFFRAHLTFQEQFNRYERRVLQYSEQKGLHRLDLRLTPEDLASLLDYKSLERMRDDIIHPLKDFCHRVFRGQNRTDLLDRYVSDIFHELSILKEEHYNVKTYAPQYARDSAKVELNYILDEVHELFPKKLNQIKFLFQKAQDRMDELLSSFTGNRIFIRSLYLHRDDFIKECYPEGVRRFYWLMYPALGPLEGFYEAGMSFLRSGFLARALEAFKLAEAELQVNRQVAAKAKKHEKWIRSRLKELHHAELHPPELPLPSPH